MGHVWFMNIFHLKGFIEEGETWEIPAGDTLLAFFIDTRQ